MNVKLQIVRGAPVGPLDLDRLTRMRPDQLQRLHRKMFGCDVPSGNSEQVRRRIAWRVQAEREGGLPESARQHALALARESGTRIRVGITQTRRQDRLQHATVTGLVSDHDPRVPMPGSVIVKEYHGKTIFVRVLASGFEWDGRRFASLSAIAQDITGTKWNGLAFFGLAKKRANGR
jgi:hypothetical protein